MVQVKPGDVWEFAWQRIPAIMRDNLLLYLVLLLVGVALTSWSSTARSFHTAGVEWIAGIAALGAAVRGVVPTYAMTLRTAAWVTLFYMLFSIGAVVAIATPVLVALWFRQAALAWILLPEIVAILWIAVKLSATAAFYALHQDRNLTIFSAMRLSWQRISGGRWAQLFSVQMIVGIGAGVIITALSLSALFGLHRNPTAAVILASSAYYVIVIPTTAFSTALTVAVASSSEPATVPATLAV